MTKTFEELSADLKRIKQEMDLARFHQHKYAQIEQGLYKDYCVALARLMDAPEFAKSCAKVEGPEER